jgi:putative ABC transport system permease protein
MRALTLGLRTLAREWRSGELGVLLLALVVAVAALTGVGLLVDRVDRAMRLQASEVLGADLRLQSGNAIPAAYADAARQQGLATSRATSMLSVVLHGEASQLANLYAVAPGYPLRGTVRVTDAAFGAPAPTRDIPAPGEIWPDSRLIAALGAQVGDTLSVGAVSLRIGRVLVSRPDQGSGFVELAPSLLMNDADLPATQLIQPGSRVGHAALFAGAPALTAGFAQWIEAHKQPGERLRDLREASPEVGNASTRATKFLLLASLAAVLLCAVAVAMTARRYVQRHLDIVALLKTLGATERFALLMSLGQLTVIACIATLIGSGMGYVAQAWLLSALQGLLAAELPAPSLAPFGMGFVTALLLLTGFALPPMLQLSQVPAIRILRRDTGAPRLASVLAFGPAVAAILLLLLWVTGDWRLAAWFALSLALIVALLGGAGLLLVRGMGAFRGGVGVAWRYGLANLARRRAESVVQIIAFGLGLTALLLLAVIRGDLITSWRSSLPTDAPNYFFVNIPPDDRDAFGAFIAGHGGHITRLLPMIRARLTAINGEPVARRRPVGARGEGFAQREQNLSWSAELGPGNTITAGRWFTADDAGKPLVSVATDFQESLNLKLGDRLGFDVAGETYEVTVSSFRKVKWDSLQPNFFLMFPPGLLDATAGTYMTSARYAPTEASSIASLVRRFPSVSVFDMEDLLAQLRSIIDKAVLAVQSVFVFTLFAGLTVLLAAVQGSREERRYESAMLRTLGARGSVVLQGVLVEFAAIGLLSGLLAAGIASIAGHFLATRMLEVPYTANPLLWLEGLSTGLVLVCVAGYLATRSAIRRSPMGVLRQG